MSAIRVINGVYRNRPVRNQTFTLVSGFQTGADLGGIAAAYNFGIETGGHIPKGFLTEYGPKPELAQFGAIEHSSDKYPPRTFENAKNSDGTIRFASNFNSGGERCTLKAIKQYNKPYIDVDVIAPIDDKEVIEWIVKNQIKVLNVAGNRESTSPGIFKFTKNYLFGILCKLN